jgi:two-component system sensor histidine kinase MtrB
MRLERIVGNLLDNAAVHAPETPVTLSATVRDRSLIIDVADRGPAVPEEDLPHLFERFYKSDRSRRGSGSGLGLAIAREHARRMGGELTAELREGGGLLFTLELPVTNPLPDGDAGVTRGRDSEIEEE